VVSALLALLNQLSPADRAALVRAMNDSSAGPVVPDSYPPATRGNKRQ
jgi:hypothetical protein